MFKYGTILFREVDMFSLYSWWRQCLSTYLKKINSFQVLATNTGTLNDLNCCITECMWFSSVSVTCRLEDHLFHDQGQIFKTPKALVIVEFPWYQTNYLHQLNCMDFRAFFKGTVCTVQMLLNNHTKSAHMSSIRILLFHILNILNQMRITIDPSFTITVYH